MNAFFLFFISITNDATRKKTLSTREKRRRRRTGNSREKRERIVISLIGLAMSTRRRKKRFVFARQIDSYIRKERTRNLSITEGAIYRYKRGSLSNYSIQ